MSEIRDLDIEVELEVDASELITANAKIDALIENIKRIDDVIKINVKLDILDALQELTQLQSIIEALESQTIKPKIDVDIAAATAKLALLQSQINNMSGEHIPIIITSNGNGNNGPPHDQHINLHLDTSAAMQKIEALRAQLNSLDDVTKIKIDVDITEVMANLMTLKSLLATMNTHTINIDVDMGAAMAQLLALQALLQLLGNGGGGPNPPIPNLNGMIGHPAMMAGKLALLWAKLFVIVQVVQALASVAMVAVGAIGTLGVAIGLLASGALALGGAFAVALAGIGGAAAFAIPSVMALYKEGAKLNDLQKETKTHIDSLKNAWGRFVDANQATALDLTSHGVNVLKTSLTMLEPVLTAGANAMDILMHNLDRALQGEQMTAFFDSMKRQIPQMTEWIGNGIGNIARGAANLMTAFEPLTMWMGEGFANMMQRFSNWTFNLQGNEKLMAFIEYVKTNLPALGSGLGDATTGIVNFFAAFGDTASKGIQWFADTMAQFDTWSSNLGNNDGFQKMLSDIETMAPKVADAIGLIADSFMELTDFMANGGGMDNIISVLEGVNKTLSADNPLGKLLFGGESAGGIKLKVTLPPALDAGLKILGKGADWLLGDSKGSTLASRGIDVKVNTSNITNDITSATKGPFDVGAQVNELKPPMMINPIDVPAQVNDLQPPMLVDPIDVMARATDMQVGEVTSPVNIPATVNEVTPPPTLPSLELAGRVHQIDPPPSGVMPAVDVPAKVTNVEAPRTLPAIDVPAKMTTIEPPPTRVVSLPVKASSVDTTGLAPVRMPLSLSGTNPLNNFNWPPLPKFTFPPLPVFTFPPLPVFTWPALPKWTWPAFPKFSWPAYPKFSWPPMPTVKVNVSGADGSHSDGLGRVPFDGYIGELHRNEAILTASQAGALRSMGMLKGDGERPTLDMSAAPSSTSATYVTTAQSSGGNTTQNTFSVNITVNGGDSPKQTAINVREEFEKFFASLNDTIDLRVEG